MFKVVEIIDKDAIHLPVKPNVKIYAGDVLRTQDYEGHLVVTHCEDAGNVFGLAGKRVIGKKEFDYANMAEVWVSRMVIRMDRYDPESKMKSGADLFVKNGKVTSIRPSANCLVVGKVISVINKNGKESIEALWF